MMVTFSLDRFLLFLIRQIDWGRRGERKKGHLLGNLFRAPRERGQGLGQSGGAGHCKE